MEQTLQKLNVLMTAILRGSEGLKERKDKVFSPDNRHDHSQRHCRFSFHFNKGEMRLRTTT
jgi:hypothetical protein